VRELCAQKSAKRISSAKKMFQHAEQPSFSLSILTSTLRGERKRCERQGGKREEEGKTKEGARLKKRGGVLVFVWLPYSNGRALAAMPRPGWTNGSLRVTIVCL